MRVFFLATAIYLGLTLLAEAQSITIDGNTADFCSVIPGTLYCAPKTLTWNKGSTSYQRYAIYRLKSDNCAGSDSNYPGLQMICPSGGSGSIQIYPGISAPGCQAIYRYTLVGSNKLCGNMQYGDGEFFPLVEAYTQISP